MLKKTCILALFLNAPIWALMVAVYFLDKYSVCCRSILDFFAVVLGACGFMITALVFLLFGKGNLHSWPQWAGILVVVNSLLFYWLVCLVVAYVVIRVKERRRHKNDK